MNDGKYGKQQECAATLQPDAAISAGGDPLRVDLGQSRFSFWHDDRALAEVRSSFWQSPGLYARRLARKR